MNCRMWSLSLKPTTLSHSPVSPRVLLVKTNDINNLHVDLTVFYHHRVKKNAPQSARLYVHIRFQPFVSGSVVVFG